METNKDQFWNKAMYWGFIIALASMLLTSLYYSTDNMFAQSKQWFDTAIYVAGIVLCTLAYRKTLGKKDDFTYGKALGLGVSASFFASLILALFTFILYNYIDPELIDKTLLHTEETLIESGLSDDMIEMQIEMARKLLTPIVLTISTIFSTVFTGLIIALISSIFLKKKSENGFESAMNELND
jgi:hypothetical protein